MQLGRERFEIQRAFHAGDHQRRNRVADHGRMGLDTDDLDGDRLEV
jgi:hypothetical protein